MMLFLSQANLRETEQVNTLNMFTRQGRILGKVSMRLISKGRVTIHIYIYIYRGGQLRAP